MPSRIYITGIGIISALGDGVAANLDALRSGQTGIDFPRHLNTVHKDEFVTGEVKFSRRELLEKAGLPVEKPLSRTALLGLIAAREAVESAGFSGQLPGRAGIVNGTSVGGMDLSEQYYPGLKHGLPGRDVEIFRQHDCGFSTEFIARQLGIQHLLSTISTACSSSANAIMHAAKLIRAKKLDCVLAGGTDALSLFTLNGFNALKILDHELCKPFDQNRAGLNLGEGAAYVVLESEAHLEKRKRQPFAAITGYGNANDAYHQTASSPEGTGAYLAMKSAVEMAQVGSGGIDYINAHGTGTLNNDLSESTALKLMFSENIPDYSATKSFTGHTLGAAGGMEAVFSILAIQHNVKYPTINLSHPMEVPGKAPLLTLAEGPVNCVLSNSFGFGGNCTSLIFSK